MGVSVHQHVPLLQHRRNTPSVVPVAVCEKKRPSEVVHDGVFFQSARNVAVVTGKVVVSTHKIGNAANLLQFFGNFLRTAPHAEYVAAKHRFVGFFIKRQLHSPFRCGNVAVQVGEDNYFHLHLKQKRQFCPRNTVAFHQFLQKTQLRTRFFGYNFLTDTLNYCNSD